MEFGGKLNMLISNLGGSFDAVQATLMSQPERMAYIAKQVGQVGDKIRGMSDLGQRAILKELAGTLGVDVGMIRSLINKDKSADIQRFISGTTNLSAMNTTEQARLAREMTTREDKKNITNEQLMGNLTIAAEGLAQSVTDIKQAGIRAGQRTLLKKLDKFAPAIDKTATAIGEFALEANTGNKNISELITQLQKLIQGNTAQANAIITLARSKGNMTASESNTYKQFMATMGLSGVVK
jgi:tellurite resistance protein